MSPKLARLSGKEMCSVLKQHGFMLKRIRGSHPINQKTSLDVYVTVPVHGNEILKPKTLKSISQQADLDVEEFIR